MNDSQRAKAARELLNFLDSSPEIEDILADAVEKVYEQKPIAKVEKGLRFYSFILGFCSSLIIIVLQMYFFD